MYQNHPREIAKLAITGCGKRCLHMLPVLLEMKDVRITAVCDRYLDKAQKVADLIREAYGSPCNIYEDHREMLEKEDADGVLIFTSWQDHCAVAIDAMEAGKYAAIESAGGSSIEELWELVRTQERTGVPCTVLENCCYDRNEMAILNMIRQGVFGEVVHAEGGYGHDLRANISGGREVRHYRFDHNHLRNADLYPGHAIGPISKYLNINRGNRLLTLVSMSSKAAGVHDYLRREKGEEYDRAVGAWAEGDVVTTMIRCANGETILLIHDTTLPRYYSRFGSVRGTRAMWMEDGNKVFFDGHHYGDGPRPEAEPFADYYQKYEHPLWRQFEKDGVRGGHGGMDWLVLRSFVESILAGTECPMDVYDAATWMAVTVLSEQSIALGSAPVMFPDFTNGKWLHRKPWIRSRYCLEEVCTDLFDADIIAACQKESQVQQV